MKSPLYLFCLIASVLCASCGHKSSQIDYEKQRDSLFQDSVRIAKIEAERAKQVVELSYKEFVLGKTLSECLKAVEQSKSMTPFNQDGTIRYSTTLIGLEWYVDVYTHNDTIHRITLNHRDETLDIDTLYIKKYGKINYKYVSNKYQAYDEHQCEGFSRQWIFKNASINISQQYITTIDYFDTDYYERCIKEDNAEREAYEKAREDAEQQYKKELEEKAKHYSDDI